MGERWWETQGWTSVLAPYIVLIRAFLDQRISAVEFELLYLTVFKADDRLSNDDPAFKALDRLFADIDAFCDDRELRERTGGIDASELSQRAGLALSQLSSSANRAIPD